MSEADVSLIRDEDLLRRMWQQTEDFSRKKEIRAHMYRLREERLRDLYSPEPHGKGGDHMASFADQSFQRIKGKEVRDAASPTKDFADRHQDLKELSNAGWNVQSENRTTDDGHTHIEALQADIQGHYDVEGGKGHFAAIDQQTRAKTEYKDDHKQIKKQENVAKSHAHEQVQSATADGTQMSSTTSSSATQYRQVSSVQEFIPFETTNQRSESRNTDRSEYTAHNDHQTRQTEYKKGELISRKVDYPDENTKVIVETRCLPDGTKIISTKKEFRGQDVSRTERQSQSKSETKSYSTQQHCDTQTSSKITEQNYDSRRDIVDSQRAVDDYDFNKKSIISDRQINDYHEDTSENNVKNEFSFTSKKQTNIENISNTRTSQKHSIESQNAPDNCDTNRTEHIIEHHVKKSDNTYKPDRRDSVTSQQSRTTQNTVDETFVKDVKRNEITNERIEKTKSEQYQTTYQDDYSQKKISNDWSPSHQAWASTLRADTPSATRPSTRASSPGSRTFQSSNSSLRSSVSPDKAYNQAGSRGSSPNKVDRSSPSRSDKYASHSTQSVSENRTSNTKTYKYTSPDRKPRTAQTNTESLRHRPSASPEKRPDISHQRASVSPDKRPEQQGQRPSVSPEKRPDISHQRASVSPDKRPEQQGQRASVSPEKRTYNVRQKSDESRELGNIGYSDRDTSPTKNTFRSSISPKKSPKPTERHASTPKSDVDSRRASASPDRKLGCMPPTAGHTDQTVVENSTKTVTSNVTKDHYKFTNDTTKHDTRTVKSDDSKFGTFTRSSKSPSPARRSPPKESSPIEPHTDTPYKPALRQESRSPSPPKGPVTFTSDTYESNKIHTVKSSTYNSGDVISNATHTTRKLSKEISPIKNSDTKQRDHLSREPSPSKLDKKSNVKNVENNLKNEQVTNEKHNSLRRKESPAVKQSPEKTYPRDGVSPTKGTKYTSTQDFISTERQTEEIHTKGKSKDRPRQLVTPSTSPSRKPKVEPELSTGQSSPTSSVSGFEYYSGHVPVTDLDDESSYCASTISENTDITILTQLKESESVKLRSTSPSKIPSKSPSPEKRVSPIKETLPRKSSLKKPSVDLTATSGPEKPTSILFVSPTKENSDNSEHKIVKKDRPDKPELDSPAKPKPPFERRETYEERCRKILGMIDDKSRTDGSNTNVSSPSVSTCSTPILQGESPSEFSKNIITKSVTDVTDFITHEREDIIKATQMNKSTDKTSKIRSPSRDSSPTKLKDIITNKTTEVFSQDKNVPSLMQQNDDNPSHSPIGTTGPRDISPRKSPSPQRTPRRSQSPKKESADTKLTSTRTNDTKNINTFQNTNIETKYHSISPSVSPTRKSAKESVNNIRSAIPVKQSEGPKSRTPSPTKKTYDRSPTNQRTPSPTKKVNSETSRNVSHSVHESDDMTVTMTKNKIIDTSDFIVTEREKEVLEKVQNSLRKLSPERSDRRSSSREKSPNKTTIRLQDLDDFETGVSSVQTKDTKESLETKTTSKDTIKQSNKTMEKKNEQKVNSKPTSRNVSPVKKVSPVSPIKTDKKIEPQTKSRSISPKKALTSSIERPRSPQVPKTSGIKPQETTSKKPSVGNTSPVKFEKTTPTDKKSPVTKQPSSITGTKSTMTKTTVTSNKVDLNSKRLASNVTNKGINKENVSPKREPDRVTRTTSDISMRLKKPSPTRVKSKPEIQVNDSPKSSSSPHRQRPKESSKLAPKPKSATALNTSPDDDDDIIIDVELAKSSRENSPDRICPTPIGFMEDVGTPRFPDEVNEPDDEFKRRTHHVIHETESIVDDIVEISEEDELFVKRPENISGSDECLLSVTDKVSKFTDKISSLKKPREKDTTIGFKDTERREYSDYTDENLKSDECLMSVSQKVNKFAKGQPDTKDTNNSSRKIADEYDVNTVYQDDYTKLSVNDKAHLFIETAEQSKATKSKPVQKVQRPDLTDVDEALKTDDCLLSVSDKVNKFVKTAEQFLSETRADEEKDKRIREQHDFIMRQIVNDVDDVHTRDGVHNTDITSTCHSESSTLAEESLVKLTKERPSSSNKAKELSRPDLKSSDKPAPIKITALRSSESVKKAKALFENIASTTQKSTDIKSARLTDIGIIKKSSSTDSANSNENTDDRSAIPTVACEVDGQVPIEPHTLHVKKPNSTPTRLTAPLSDTIRQKSPLRQTIDTPRPERRSASPRPPVLSTKDKENVPGYLRSTKTSQLKEETKIIEEHEVSTRRGSGKFGVELRRASADKPMLERGPSSERPSAERRRSSDRPLPCIEDIYDVALLEQMLEKVVGYEQRRRIRAQIRVARKKMEDTNAYIKSTKTVTSTKTVNTDRQPTKSPERQPASYAQRVPSTEPHVPHITAHKPTSPDRTQPKDQSRFVNGHTKLVNGKARRTPSPEKIATAKTRSPLRPSSPEKRTRPQSPTKTVTPSKPKSNRFSEYAAAYMKKVGLDEKEAIKTEVKNIKLAKDSSKTTETRNIETVHVKEHEAIETKLSSSSITRSVVERNTPSDKTEIQKINGKRSPSPEKRKSPKRRASSPQKSEPRSPSPMKRQNSDTASKKETIIKPVFEIEKKLQPKPVVEEKPSWVTNRNLKKITSETRTFSSKKIEPEKTKYRAPSPSKAIVKPIDVITSSYGPGPLDAEGKPLFGIKALRNGASNCQVKGTVVRQEYRSQNGGAAEGSVSVTAYSSQPEPLEQLLQKQGQPRFLQGLAAITTTKKFGGDTGVSLAEAYTKEERAALEQFTHSDLRHTDHVTCSSDRADATRSQLTITDVTDRDSSIIDTHSVKQSSVKQSSETQSSRKQVSEKRSSVERAQDEKRTEDSSRKQQRKTETLEKREEKTMRAAEKKTVRQSSVKSLTEKYIKSTNETPKSDRSMYPKAGLILRATGAARRDSPAGLPRADSEHSLRSEEGGAITHCTAGDTRRETTVTQETKGVTSSRRGERSFLDSSTKVSGVQDILTRMRNADIVIEDGDTSEDAEARALLNKFLGATVLMAGMQSYVTDAGAGAAQVKHQESVTRSINQGSSPRLEDVDLEQCWDERLLKTLLEQCQDYEQRRRIRARLRALMAEQEACAQAVTAALGAAGDACDEREEAEEVTSVSSSVRRDSSENTVTTTTTTTRSSKVIESMTRPAPNKVSPFAKFRQLEKQNSTNSSKGAPLFRITDPALQASALTIKERLLQWCRDKTRDYENVKLENFSTSWADGLAFCALVHHFLPDAFDYSALTADQRRHNFTLAFKVADEKAGIYPLLDVEDMVAMRRPDWKCVFTYVQAIHRRFRDQR